MTAQEFQNVFNDKNNYRLYEEIYEDKGKTYIPLKPLTEMNIYNSGNFIDENDACKFLFNKDYVLQIDDIVILGDMEKANFVVIESNVYDNLNKLQRKDILANINKDELLKVVSIHANGTRGTHWGSCVYCGLAVACVASGVLAAAGLLEVAACVDCALSIR